MGNIFHTKFTSLEFKLKLDVLIKSNGSLTIVSKNGYVLEVNSKWHFHLTMQAH